MWTSQKIGILSCRTAAAGTVCNNPSYFVLWGDNEHWNCQWRKVLEFCPRDKLIQIVLLWSTGESVVYGKKVSNILSWWFQNFFCIFALEILEIMRSCHSFEICLHVKLGSYRYFSLFKYSLFKYILNDSGFHFVGFVWSSLFRLNWFAVSELVLDICICQQKRYWLSGDHQMNCLKCWKREVDIRYST